mmetsp:Transcript_44737/g.91353  ORF Transcript_44737/g.91353 Transcript_44737/m.91353 type:complete len:255 (+) Transcript_44737:1331-2095(+)
MENFGKCIHFKPQVIAGLLKFPLLPHVQPVAWYLFPATQTASCHLQCLEGHLHLRQQLRRIRQAPAERLAGDGIFGVTEDVHEEHGPEVARHRALRGGWRSHPVEQLEPGDLQGIDGHRGGISVVLIQQSFFISGCQKERSTCKHRRYEANKGQIKSPEAGKAMHVQDGDVHRQSLEDDREDKADIWNVCLNHTKAQQVVVNGLQHVTHAKGHANPRVGIKALPPGLQLPKDLHMSMCSKFHSFQQLLLPAEHV